MDIKTDGTTADPVLFSMRDRVAVLTIDHPPVNAGSHGVRAGLADGIARAIEEGASAAILIGAGRCFVAGSDLKEFGRPLAHPELPDVIRAIEAAPFPVVAALHGVALGGGFELALGCDYRIAMPGTQVGLPEAGLGFVPGAGGTQRMPRLAGRARAIDLICSADRIAAEDALRDGLIDAIIEGPDLMLGALGFLSQTARHKRRVIDMAPPPEDPARINEAEARALRRGKGRPNFAEAIRLIKATATTDGALALADERAVFQDLRRAEDAVALRYLFFAERRAAVLDGLDMTAARGIARVGVVGGGTMGQGIVRCCLAAGLAVLLIERDRDALERATRAIADGLAASVARGRIAADEAAARNGALQGTVDQGDCADCDLVVEAVFEDMEVKRAVLTRLDATMPRDAIIATNTSYLDIDDMAGGLSHPQRVLGLHFFSPADVMPLLEVVRAARTSDAALATALSLARRLGKQPVVARVADGFVGNRIYAAYRRRAELLVMDGTDPQRIDRAMTDFGFAMGPFMVADMSGLDIAWAMRKRQAATRDPQARYVPIADALCEAGRLGRKTGQGWYDYADGKARPSAEVEAIIDDARRAAGIAPVALDAPAIQRQLLAAIVNEAASVIDEGVAHRASDVDVALCNGYGFPRWRGGPLFWAAGQPRAAIHDDLRALGEAVGQGFRAGPVDRILDAITTGQEG